MGLGTMIWGNLDEFGADLRNCPEIDFEFHNGIKLHVIENFPSSFYGFRSATHRQGIKYLIL